MRIIFSRCTSILFKNHWFLTVYNCFYWNCLTYNCLTVFFHSFANPFFQKHLLRLFCNSILRCNYFAPLFFSLTTLCNTFGKLCKSIRKLFQIGRIFPPHLYGIKDPERNNVLNKTKLYTSFQILLQFFPSLLLSNMQSENRSSLIAHVKIVVYNFM